MDLHELRVAARLIDGLAKRALFAEKQMVALEGQCAEWQRIADDLKAERNELRSTTIDTAAGSLLDAFGSLANEPRNGAPDAEYRDRIVTTIHAIKLERDALKKERDDLWQREGIEQKRRIDVEEHFSDTISGLAALLGVDGGERSVTVAIEKLKAERDALRAQLDTERERHKQTASILAQYAPKTMQIEPPPEATHDTPEGKQAAEAAVKDGIRAGDKVEVFQKTTDETLFDDISICGAVSEVFWSGTGTKCVRLIPRTMNRNSRGGETFGYDDVRKIAQKTAQTVEPKPGDVVRLVRVPTVTDCPRYDDKEVKLAIPLVNTLGKVVGMSLCEACARVSVFGSVTIKSWPLSCIEVVTKGATP